jgi:hypothetical protein
VVDVDGLIRLSLSVHQDLRGGLVDVDVGKDVVMMSAFSLRIFERYGRRYTSRSTEERGLTPRYKGDAYSLAVRAKAS